MSVLGSVFKKTCPSLFSCDFFFRSCPADLFRECKICKEVAQKRIFTHTVYSSGTQQTEEFGPYPRHFPATLCPRVPHCLTWEQLASTHLPKIESSLMHRKPGTLFNMGRSSNFFSRRSSNSSVEQLLDKLFPG